MGVGARCWSSFLLASICSACAARERYKFMFHVGKIVQVKNTISEGPSNCCYDETVGVQMIAAEVP